MTLRLAALQEGRVAFVSAVAFAVAVQPALVPVKKQVTLSAFAFVSAPTLVRLVTLEPCQKHSMLVTPLVTQGPVE